MCECEQLFRMPYKDPKKKKKKLRKSDLSCTMNTKYCYEILDVPWKYIFTFFLRENKWYLGRKDDVGEESHLEQGDMEKPDFSKEK